MLSLPIIKTRCVELCNVELIYVHVHVTAMEVSCTFQVTCSITGGNHGIHTLAMLVVSGLMPRNLDSLLPDARV